MNRTILNALFITLLIIMRAEWSCYICVTMSEFFVLMSIPNKSRSKLKKREHYFPIGLIIKRLYKDLILSQSQIVFSFVLPDIEMSPFTKLNSMMNALRKLQSL